MLDPDATTEASKMELFQALANKGRVNFDRKRPHTPPQYLQEVDEENESVGSAGSSPKRTRIFDDNDGAESIHEGSNRGDPPDEDDRHVKMTILHELARMRDGGALLSRTFTMQDALCDIEFEFERQKQIAAARSGIDFMKQFIRLALTGVEFVNSRFSLMRLEGYTEDVCRDDMRRFDRPLQRIHKRLFRRSTMNPFVELAMLILGSAVTKHFSNAMQGPRGSTGGGIGSLAAGLMGGGGLGNLANIFGAAPRAPATAPAAAPEAAPEAAGAAAKRMRPPVPM